jgi:uncharacterized membrane protein YhhN
MPFTENGREGGRTMFDNALTMGDGLDALRWALTALSLGTSLAYLAHTGRPVSAWRTALKAGGIGALVPLPLLALSMPGTPGTALILLAAALLFSCLGDIFLALKNDPRNFSRGLGAFLISHLFYLAVMLPLASAPGGLPSALGDLQWAGLALLALMAGGVLAWLWPVLGRLRLAVTAYLGVISAMAAAALCVAGAVPWLGLGALLFVLSDALIAIDKFRRPVPFRGPAIWITYYAGQVLIAASLLALLTDGTH